MSQRIIIHSYTPTSSGIGDFFRAAAHLYQYCKLHNIQYFIDITNPIGKYFDFKTYTGDTTEFEKKIIWSSHPYDIYQDFLLSAKNTIITTNKLILEYCFESDYVFALREIIKPTNYISNKHKQLLKEYNLIENNYSCIHIRFGDKYLTHSDKDDRINTTPLPISERFDKCIPYINKDLPIVLLTDDYEQKVILSKKYNLIFLDIKPVHTSYNPTDTEAEETVLEFLTFGASIKVHLLSRSGFSRIGALYGNKPYKLFDK